MIHRESISIEDYTNEFEIPYLAEFADTFRKYVVKSGVKNCFCLDMPLYAPGQLKPIQILLKKKGTDSFDCSAGTIRTNYAWNSTIANLKDEVLKGFQITREWDDEIGEVYFYGLHVSAKIFCQMNIDLSFQKIVTGVYRISDSGTLGHETQNISNIYDLCNSYDVEFDGKTFDIVLPNISTKYAMRRFFDYIQFVNSIKECGS